MLRSIKQVYGDKPAAADGETGRVSHWVVEAGHRDYGREIVISPSDIQRISDEESAVFGTVTQAAIRDAAEYPMPRAAHHDAREPSESTV